MTNRSCPPEIWSRSVHGLALLNKSLIVLGPSLPLSEPQQPGISSSNNHNSHLMNPCTVPGTASESCFISFMHFRPSTCFSSFSHSNNALGGMLQSQFYKLRFRDSKDLNPGLLTPEAINGLLQRP